MMIGQSIFNSVSLLWKLDDHINIITTLMAIQIRKIEATIEYAIVKLTPTKLQVPVYWAAQYLGAFLASAILYGNYADFIR